MVTGRQLLVALPVLLGVLIASAWALRALRESEPLVIACMRFTESRLLAEIMAQTIRRSTGRDVVCEEVDSTSACYADLRQGSAQLASVYSGSLLTEVYRLPPEPDPQRAAGMVADRTVQDSAWLTVGNPFGCDGRYVLAMRRDLARRLGATSISDLAGHSEIWIGCIPDFIQRADGWPGLSHLYHLHLKHAPVALARGGMVHAIQDGRVEIIAASDTDPGILAGDLQVLTDNLHYFPSYRALPLMRRDIMDQDPAIEMALVGLAGRIDDRTMRAMNAEVDLSGRAVDAVARAFVTHLAQAHP